MGEQVLRSNDGGATWEPTAYPGSGVLSLDLGPDGVLFAGSVDGAFRSEDGGATWEALGPEGQQVQRIGSLTGGQLFARVGNASSCTVLRSDDDGGTWRPVASVSPTGCLDFLVALSDNALLLIGRVHEFEGEIGRTIYRSLSGGATWHERDFLGVGIARFVVGQYGEVFAVALATRDDIFAGGLDSGLYRYGSGGAWAKLSDAPVSTATTLPDGSTLIGMRTGVPAEGLSAPDPRTIVTGPDGSLVVSTWRSGLYWRAPGGEWVQTDGLHQSAYSFAFDSAGRVGAANGAALLRHDGLTWRPTPWARGGADEIVFRDGDTLLVASEQGGLWNATVDEPIVVAPACQYLLCYTPAFIQTTSGYLFASMTGQDGGDYCGTEDVGVYRSLNGGQTWQLSMPDFANICRLAAGPDDIVVAGAGGCGCDFEGYGVYRTADAGATWGLLSDGFPNAEVTALAIGPAKEVVAGARANGVFRLRADGVWIPLGLEAESVETLAINADGQVLAGTDRGVFIYDGVNWRAGGLAGEKVHDLLIGAGGFGYAATETGAYRSTQPVVVSEESGPVSAEAVLGAAYPNPFHEQTEFVLTLPTPTDLTVVAYDVLGRRAAVLHRGPLSAGEHRLSLDGRSLRAGTYVVRVSGAVLGSGRRVVLVR